jgi:hypothetical protein
MLAEPAATDAEIAAMAARWGLSARVSGPAHRKPTSTHVHQSLGHGRSNVVAVEIKHSGRFAHEGCSATADNTRPQSTFPHSRLRPHVG